MMARTRKRDDDSQYTSDATSLAALDASSIDATGSRSSRTFASSTKALNGKQRRPAKRRRKSLTDALQSISLDKDKGVPQQILSSKTGGFPFSNNTKSVAFATNGGASMILPSSQNFTYLNLKQQAERQLDRANIVVERDGDIYYDDDNSQLTSSSEEREDEMEDLYDEDDEDEDDDSLRKRLAGMTEFEKAQRKVMLKLVFGKDHEESTKLKPSKVSSFSGPREVSSCARLPPELIVNPLQKPSSLPAFATVSTRTKVTPITPATTPISKPVIPPKEDGKDKTKEYKDPADRKIEELVRQSLQNLRDGSHPLLLPNKEDNDSFVTTPWKTQDDMAVDPQIYSPRIPMVSMAKSSMSLDTESMDSQMASSHNSSSMTQRRPFARQRSNSLPGGLDMTDTSSDAMDTDG